jgi:hypothetical protein
LLFGFGPVWFGRGFGDADDLEVAAGDAHGGDFERDALTEAGGVVVAEKDFELVLVGRGQHEALLVSLKQATGMHSWKAIGCLAR